MTKNKKKTYDQSCEDVVVKQIYRAAKPLKTEWHNFKEMGSQHAAFAQTFVKAYDRTSVHGRLVLCGFFCFSFSSNYDKNVFNFFSVFRLCVFDILCILKVPFYIFGCSYNLVVFLNFVYFGGAILYFRLCGFDNSCILEAPVYIFGCIVLKLCVCWRRHFKFSVVWFWNYVYIGGAILYFRLCGFEILCIFEAPFYIFVCVVLKLCVCWGSNFIFSVSFAAIWNRLCF